jgi:HK97 gp10 family phage protein
MRETAGLTIIGDKELRKSLQRMGSRSISAIMRPAIRAGLEPIYQQARANTPWPSIRKMIKRKVRITKRTVHGVVQIGDANKSRLGQRVVKYKGRLIDFSFVAWVLEFGSRKQHIRARAFMRNARAQRGEEAMRIVQEEAERRVMAEWGRA